MLGQSLGGGKRVFPRLGNDAWGGALGVLLYLERALGARLEAFQMSRKTFRRHLETILDGWKGTGKRAEGSFGGGEGG